METLTRRNGIILCIVGITILMLNFLTMTLWDIDIDILGVVIFILGLLLIVVCGKTMKKSSELFSRRNGVRLCIVGVIVALVPGYLPMNGDTFGIAGMFIFLLGIVVIAFRWIY
jgi:hypothetical protein